jgi:hypothetical protein
LPGDPLLDDPAAKVGIDQATRRSVNRPALNRVADPSFSGKPRKRLVLEYQHSPQSFSSRGSQPKGHPRREYNTECYELQGAAWP